MSTVNHNKMVPRVAMFCYFDPTDPHAPVLLGYVARNMTPPLFHLFFISYWLSGTFMLISSLPPAPDSL